VHSAESGVVHDPLGTENVGGETDETVHGRASLTASLGDRRAQPRSMSGITPRHQPSRMAQVACPSGRSFGYSDSQTGAPETSGRRQRFFAVTRATINE
jgi:hypothetical protein